MENKDFSVDELSRQGEWILSRDIVDLQKGTLAGRRFNVTELGELINKSYLKGRREPSDRAKKSFAPSGVGYGAGVCPRRWFYDFSGGIVREEDADAMSVANMAYGTEAHERLQKVFAESGVLVEAERKIDTIGHPDLPPILGFVDLVINWQGEEVVGEIKTTMQESYVSKKAKNTPAGYHLLQVLIYMKVLGLNKGFIIYENKNTQQLLVMPVTWNVANTKLINDTFDWMTTVHENWKAGKKPTRPFRSEKSVACKSCPFTKMCWEDEEGEITLPILEVPK